MTVANYLLQLSLICPISAPDTASTSSPPGPPSGECIGCSSSRRPGGSLRRARAAGPPSTVRYGGSATLIRHPRAALPTLCRPWQNLRPHAAHQIWRELFEEQSPIPQTVTLRTAGRKPMNKCRGRGQEEINISRNDTTGSILPEVRAKAFLLSPLFARTIILPCLLG